MSFFSLLDSLGGGTGSIWGSSGPRQTDSGQGESKPLSIAGGSGLSGSGENVGRRACEEGRTIGIGSPGGGGRGSITWAGNGEVG